MKDYVLEAVDGVLNRARLLIGSQICEDILEYNRCHEMFYQLSPDHVKKNIDNENFGESYDLFLGTLPQMLIADDGTTKTYIQNPQKLLASNYLGIKEKKDVKEQYHLNLYLDY